MSKPIPKLKLHDILIALEDIIIPGTAFYIYKGKKYKVREYLPEWNENAWNIILMNRFRTFGDQGWFTEEELFEKFDCVTTQRRKKLKRLSEINA